MRQNPLAGYLHAPPTTSSIFACASHSAMRMRREIANSHTTPYSNVTSLHSPSSNPITCPHIDGGPKRMATRAHAEVGLWGRRDNVAGHLLVNLSYQIVYGLKDLRSSCGFMHKTTTPYHEGKDHRMLRLGPQDKSHSTYCPTCGQITLQILNTADYCSPRWRYAR